MQKNRYKRLIRNKQAQSGMKFNKLTLLSLNYTDDISRQFWNCKCECGNIKIMFLDSVITSKSKSCGCVRKQRIEANKNAQKSEKQTIYQGYKNKAKHRELEFCISKIEFLRLTQQPCYFCGVMHSNLCVTPRGYPEGWKYNGVDRVDNTKGYTLDNCVPCCRQCNFSKSNYTKIEFLNWIERVYNNSVGAHGV